MPLKLSVDNSEIKKHTHTPSHMPSSFVFQCDKFDFLSYAHNSFFKYKTTRAAAAAVAASEQLVC